MGALEEPPRRARFEAPGDAKSTIATLLKEQGKLAEAEPLYREVLEGFREVLGPRHPDTLISVNNLAVLLMDQGKLAEAEPLSARRSRAAAEVNGLCEPRRR